jgi:NTE family protein
MLMADSTTGSDSGKDHREPGVRPKVGIALGAGGAKGIAHIPMLEALDELEVIPHRIAGTSIGAVIGALYASGMSALEIREMAARLAITKHDNVRGILSNKKIGKWMAMIDPQFGHGGLLNSDAIMTGLSEEGSFTTFEELAIPLTLVATDFQKGRAVLLDSGPLKPAVQASMALPGVFNPIELDGRVLVDGATVNPVPFNVLFDSCDLVIAIDIGSDSYAESDAVPGYFDTIFGSIQIMQAAIVEQEISTRPPDIYIKPEVHDVRILEFNRADEVYHQAQPAKEELKRKLAKALESYSA